MPRGGVRGVRGGDVTRSRLGEAKPREVWEGKNKEIRTANVENKNQNKKKEKKVWTCFVLCVPFQVKISIASD